MRRLHILVAAFAFVFATGCSSSTSDSAPPKQTDPGSDRQEPEESDDNQRQDDRSEDDSDQNNETDEPDQPDDDTTEDENDGKEDSTTGGIPDDVTTNGGDAFSGTINPGDAIEITLDANQGDFIVARLEATGDSEWTPRLEISRGGEQIAWHEADSDGVAHIPYEDGKLEQGWEFYEAGEHTLTLQNVGSSAGQFNFELICKSGECTNTSDDNDSSDDSGDDGNDSNENVAADCPTATGDALEQQLREEYSVTNSLSYDQARVKLWREIYNEGGSVEGVYTGQTVRTNTIPDPSEFNTEHGVPRSKIEGEGPAFSDIHHLYPSESQANAKRSNLPFDDVTGRTEWSQSGSKRGANENGTKVFEPRDVRKGDLARSVFYFAVMYDREVDISAERDGWGIGLADEDTLRRWHNQVDPVSSGERSRNQAISEVQGNINPFIKCPNLVSKISDF